MTNPLVLHRRICFQWEGRQKTVQRAEDQPATEMGRVPRVARLMALAIRLNELVTSGQVANAAAWARQQNVSRARITQILNLNLLAPDIQEAVLFLPPVIRGPDAVSERDLRPIAAEPDWTKQRKMWVGLVPPPGVPDGEPYAADVTFVTREPA